MRFKDLLNEKWKSTFRKNVVGGVKTIDVFENPSRKEFREIIKSSPYNALKGLFYKGNIYLFIANVEHRDISKHLKIDNNKSISFYYNDNTNHAEVYLTNIMPELVHKEKINIWNKISKKLPLINSKVKVLE